MSSGFGIKYYVIPALVTYTGMTVMNRLIRMLNTQ